MDVVAKILSAAVPIAIDNGEVPDKSRVRAKFKHCWCVTLFPSKVITANAECRQPKCKHKATF